MMNDVNLFLNDSDEVGLEASNVTTIVITTEDLAKLVAERRKQIGELQAEMDKEQELLNENETYKSLQLHKKELADNKDIEVFLTRQLRDATVLESKATNYEVKKFGWAEVKRYASTTVTITDKQAALEWAIKNAPEQVELKPTFNDAVAGLQLPFMIKEEVVEYKAAIKKDLSAFLEAKSE